MSTRYFSIFIKQVFVADGDAFRLFEVALQHVCFKYSHGITFRTRDLLLTDLVH